jgi:deoxyribodipyrimidine photo-lyase
MRPKLANRTPDRPCRLVSSARALVWFKRDLRLLDHAPLAQAMQFESAAGLLVIEPEWLHSPECDPQHVAFYLACAAELQAKLAALGLPLLVRTGSMPAVLQALHQQWRFTHLLSHEETGPLWSFRRDQEVARWCSSASVQWLELPQTGVVRRLRSRDGWARRWLQRMNAPITAEPTGFKGAAGLQAEALPSLRDLGLSTPGRQLPAAGEGAAWHTLDDFLAERARPYRQALSSPLTAPHSCSRLSAHLAFGTLSMRSVHQATEARIADCGDRELAWALRSFASRLRWHCHFMQKLEDEPAMECHNLAKSVNGLRAGDGAPLDAAHTERLQAWCEGRTGYPMVDACMRQLRATGWLNFRMRAMLVSFAAYHLWLHWREPGLFLARQFLDFEPGIHWSQMQMQSGTTGINTLRIYSPAKQARDHDPEGRYVAQWVPEFGTSAYPQPIVDEASALRHAKETLYGLRKSPQAQQQAQALQDKHGSRKSGLPQTGRRRAGASAPQPSGQARLQGELF